MNGWRRILVVLVVLVTSTAAFAQGEDATARARRHFGEGVKAYDAKPPDYEHALVEFRAAYAEKKSAGLKRNIALCLRGLHRYPEAMDALEEMLAEGGDSLKPEVRAGAQKALEEMGREVATVRVTVAVRAVDPNARPEVEASLDGADVPVAKLANPIRVLPGEHTFQARAAGYNAASARVTARAGDRDLPVQLELTSLVAAMGRLWVHAPLSTAQIAVDGVVIGRGEYQGNVPAGPHRIVVTDDGFVPFDQEVTVAPNEVKEVAVNLAALPLAPPVYPGPPKPEVVRNFYFVIGFGVMTETLTMSHTTFTTASDIDRGFGGATLYGRIGRKLGSSFALELFGEVGAYGSLNKSYSAAQQYGIIPWALGPELRFRTRGKARFVAGLAAGLEGEVTDAKITGIVPCNNPDPATHACEVKGSGFSGFGLVDVGAQIQVNRTFFEVTPFVDVHGTSDPRLYTNDVTWRVGLHVLVGYDL